MKLARVGAGVAVSMIPAVAIAHAGHGVHVGFVDGLVHPFLGLDHVLAMVLVGAWAALVGGRMLVGAPAAFVAGLVLATISPIGETAAWIEPGVALTVALLGAAVAVSARAPAWFSLSVLVVFGALHGQAHAAEMSVASVSASVGFVMATILLHTVGALVAGRVATRREKVVRGAGVASALCGVVLFAMVAV